MSTPLVSLAAERHGSGEDDSGDKNLFPRHNILHGAAIVEAAGATHTDGRPAVARAAHRVAWAAGGVERLPARLEGIWEGVCQVLQKHLLDIW
jgi:hypothetical protein